MAEECEMKTRNEEFNEFNAHRFVWDTFWNELHCVESKWSADEALYVHITYIHAHTSVIDLCEQRVYDLVTKQNSQYM